MPHHKIERRGQEDRMALWAIVAGNLWRSDWKNRLTWSGVCCKGLERNSDYETTYP